MESPRQTIVLPGESRFGTSRRQAIRTPEISRGSIFRTVQDCTSPSVRPSLRMIPRSCWSIWCEEEHGLTRTGTGSHGRGKPRPCRSVFICPCSSVCAFCIALTGMDILGVHLVGLTPENGRKLLLTLIFVVVSLLISRGLQAIAGVVFHQWQNRRIQFWTQQIIKLFAVLVLVVGLVSIWFDTPARLTTVAGLLTAGLAVALQRVVTAVAAYF